MERKQLETNNYVTSQERENIAGCGPREEWRARVFILYCGQNSLSERVAFEHRAHAWSEGESQEEIWAKHLGKAWQ